MKKILVTDSLFIHKEHESLLKEAGYEVERLDKPKATEAELIEAIKGKTGYILGGVEQITESVIEAGADLKIIAFTGADWSYFVPGHSRATERGIAITNTPGANAYAVAEYTITMMLAMTRNVFELTQTGDKTFQTTKSLKDLTVGIIGMGTIGKKVTEMLNGLGVKEVIYYSPNKKDDVEAKYVELNELLSSSDIVSLHAPKSAGEGYIGKEELALMQNGTLIVDCGFMGGVNSDALYKELSKNRLRAFLDGPVTDNFKELPLYTFMHSNAHTAYNTHEANKKASDMATRSVINILETGEDEYKVN